MVRLKIDFWGSNLDISFPLSCSAEHFDFCQFQETAMWRPLQKPTQNVFNIHHVERTLYTVF